MPRKMPQRATKAERAYIQDLEHASAFDLADSGRAQVLTPHHFPEPLKRFLNRERTMIHVRLTPAIKRKLEARSRQKGVPIDELARRWIENGVNRDAG